MPRAGILAKQGRNVRSVRETKGVTGLCIFLAVFVVLMVLVIGGRTT